MASSVGSDIFAVFALLVVSLFVLLLLRHYLPLRTTPAYLLVPVFFALALPIFLVLLVPIDLASHARDSGPDSDPDDLPNFRAIWLPDGVLMAAWRITYWLTFALTWFILPFLGEYMDSGARTPRDKVFYSLRSNARYQLTVLSLGILGLVYFILQNGFRATSIKALVMALAYAWALIQALYLMGHGLVALPRRLIKYASVSGRLRRLQERAPKVHEKLEDAVGELKELDGQVAQLHSRKLGTGPDQQEWIDELAEAGERSRKAMLPVSVASMPAAQSAPPLPATVTDRYLADLNRRLLRARHKRLRFIHTWNELVDEAANTQAILDSKASRRLEFRYPVKSRTRVFGLLNPFTRYHLHNHLVPASSLLLGGVLSLVSISIVWSELFKHAAPKLSIITYLVIRHPDPGARVPEAWTAASAMTNTIPVFQQFLTSLILTYMCLSALSSLGAVPIWGNRALVPRTTYFESATWYAGQVAKLTVPLAFNFVTLLPDAVFKPTAFYRFLGVLIDITPLFRGFDHWFQFIILIPVSAALFNLYGRIGKLFSGLCGLEKLMGASLMDDDDDDEAAAESGSAPAFGSGSWREGRDLIERELRARSDDAAAVPLVDSRGPSLDMPRNPAAAAGGASGASGDADARTHVPAGRYRDEPTLTLGPAAQAAALAHDDRQARYAADRERRQRERMDAATRAAADAHELGDEEGVLEGFAHRVKNTIDSVDAPDWFVKRPKWMGGQGDGVGGTQGGGGGGSSGSSSGGGRRILGRNSSSDGGDSENEFTRTIGRIFGGRGNEGRLRLG